MSTRQQSSETAFRVIDAMKAPYRGQILRLRLVRGETPTIRELRGARLVARSPKGAKVSLRVLGFPFLGGRPSDSRLERTGRVDLVVESEREGDPPVSRRWEVLANP
jgi:hypothetical protein